jgi:hypothetical protein
LHTRLAAETHLAGGEFLEVAVNRDVFKGFQKNNNAILWTTTALNLYTNKKYNKNKETILCCPSKLKDKCH